MDAAVVRELGLTPEFGQFDEPVAGEGEALITVKAAALNPSTRATASGAHYASQREVPFVIGLDGVGLRRVDRMRGSQLAGDLQAARADVDGDDRVAAADDRRHDRGQADADAQRVSDQQESVRGKSCERLFRFLVLAHDRILDRLRTISVVIEVFAQPRRQMPNADHEKRQHDCPAGVVKSLPKMRLEHRDKKRRKKKRHGREDRSLASDTLAPIILEDLIYDAVPTRLHLARALRVRILRMQDGSGLRTLVELLIVKRAFLRIDQRVVSQRQQRELACSFLGSTIYIGMLLARQLAIGGLDLVGGR